jgi:GT2 family glycosyltransferase
VTSRPEASVVIPTRNRTALLRAHALPAALAQHGVDIEIIVVDDGSEDDDARDVAELDPRITLIRHDRHSGVSAARNTGIAHARAEWLAFLDDDDVWAPNKLSRQLDAVRGAGADFVYSSVVVVDTDLEPIRLANAPAPAELPRLVLRPSIFPGGPSNLVVKAAAMQALGGFDTRLASLEDWECWIRLVEHAKGAACPEVHVGHVIQPEGRYVAEAGHGGEFQYVHEKHPALKRVRPGADVLEARWRAYAYRRAGRRRRAAREYLTSAWRHRSGGQVLRAAGILLGEPTMRWGASGRRRTRTPPPEWLDLYRRADRGL